LKHWSRWGGRGRPGKGEKRNAEEKAYGGNEQVGLVRDLRAMLGLGEKTLGQMGGAVSNTISMFRQSKRAGATNTDRNGFHPKNE